MFYLPRVHRIADTPLPAQSIHNLHHFKRLVERHAGRLGESFVEGMFTGQELIFIARDLLGHAYFLDERAVRPVDLERLRVVDVVNDQRTLDPSPCPT